MRCFPSRPDHADGAGEGHFFDILARIDTDIDSFKRSMTRKHHGFFRDLVGKVEKLNQEQVYDLFRLRYNAFIQRQRKGKRIVGEKTPEYVFHLGLIKIMYPDF